MVIHRASRLEYGVHRPDNEKFTSNLIPNYNMKHGRCIVPLRVPVCTLTEESYFKNLKGLCLARSTARLSCRVRYSLKDSSLPYSTSSLLCYILCEHLFLILRNRLSLPGSLRGKPFPGSRGSNLHPGCRGKRRLQVSCTIAFIAYIGCCSGIPSCRPPSRPRKGRGCYSCCPVLSRHAEVLIFFVQYVKVRFVVSGEGSNLLLGRGEL